MCASNFLTVINDKEGANKPFMIELVLKPFELSLIGEKRMHFKNECKAINPKGIEMAMQK